jgi:hypothetical protein
LLIRTKKSVEICWFSVFLIVPAHTLQF